MISCFEDDYLSFEYNYLGKNTFQIIDDAKILNISPIINGIRPIVSKN
jgi:hypothetical protein